MGDVAVAYSQAPKSAVSVKDCGARGDGSTDDSSAIQQALNHGGTIVIPPGKYVIARTLLISSGTRLLAHPQALLEFAPGAGKVWNDFLLANRNPDSGDADIEIAGGIWSGNGVNNPRGQKLIDPGKYGGVMINFRNVRNLVVSDCMFCDPQSYYLRLTRVSRFVIEKIRFHAQHPCNNNDGVHLAGYCNDGIIRHLRGLGRSAPNDDMVAMNADDALDRVEVYGGECGPIRDIHVYDIAADQCHTFVRLLSVVSPIENIDIDQVKGGCDAAALNMDGARGCRVPIFDEKDPRFARGVGMVRNVRVTDMSVYKTSRNGVPLVNAQQRLDQFELRSFSRDLDRDCSPASQSLIARFMPDQFIELEGLTQAQVADLQAASTSAVLSCPASPADPANRLNLRAKVAWGEELQLPAGGFERFRAHL